MAHYSVLARLGMLAVLWFDLAAAYGASPGVTDGDCPAEGDAVRVQLVFDGIRSSKGNITVAVYGSRPSEFLAKGKKVAKGRIPARAGTVRACLFLPKPGVYALAAYHDEDGDMHLNRNFIGLPAEGYAFSNNPSSLIGLPSFRSVAFTVGTSLNAMPLHLHYP
jgi:uncharacterized protein (DUF2141 family)